MRDGATRRNGGVLRRTLALVREHPLPVLGAALGATALGTFLLLRRSESNGHANARANGAPGGTEHPSLLRKALDAVAPEPDVMDLLEKEHAEVKAMFRTLEEDREAGRPPSREVFERLCDALDRHAYGEEFAFYPVLKAADETRSETLEALTEHRVVKDLLAEIRPLIHGGDEWWAKLHVLREYVLHHAHEEEHEIFPAAKDVLGKERRVALRAEYLEAKKRAPVRPAP